MKKIILIILLPSLFKMSLYAQTYCLTANKVSESSSALTVSFSLSSTSTTLLNADVTFIVEGSGSISGTNIVAGNGFMGKGESFLVGNPETVYTFARTSDAPANFIVTDTRPFGVYIPARIERGCAINSIVFASPLPLDLKSFIVSKDKSNSLLSWQTASEEGVSHFDVERSGDGKSFSKIGTVKAVGNSKVLQSYAFTDEATLNGINYYRLKMADLDGKSKYSKVESVDFEKPLSAKTYPNPLDGDLTIEIDVDRRVGDVFVELFDVSGKQVYYKKIQSATDALNFTIPTTQLPAGMYVVRVKNGNNTSQYKITKQ